MDLLNQKNAKEPNHWDAYIPASLNGTTMYEVVHAQLARFTQRGKTLTVNTVNYTESSQQNDITLRNDLTEWHSVLIGRVLPWCQSTTVQGKSPASSQSALLVLNEEGNIQGTFFLNTRLIEVDIVFYLILEKNTVQIWRDSSPLIWNFFVLIS